MDARERKQYCIENKLCVACHEPNGNGKQLCDECADKQKARSKAQREFYISIGVCPVCCKNKLMGDEHTCLECLAKKAIRNKKRNREKDQKRRAELRGERRRNNLCPICGNQLDEDGKLTCSACRRKRRTKDANKRMPQREERIYRGQCYICGSSELAEGKKLCLDCYRRIIRNTEKMWETRRKKSRDK